MICDFQRYSERLPPDVAEVEVESRAEAGDVAASELSNRLLTYW